MRIGIANPEPAELARFLSGVVGVVEANSFESLCLWQENHKGRGRSWVSDGSGPVVEFGAIDDEKPVCGTLLVNEIDGRRILFVDVTSRFVDHDMVRDWLEANMPVTAFEECDPRKRLNMTDAMNFANVLPRRRDRDAAEGGDANAAPVPKDQQARGEAIAETLMPEQSS